MPVGNDASRFALELVKQHVTRTRSTADAKAVLAPYLQPAPRPRRMTDIYRRIAGVAQDYGMAPTVVGGSIGGVDKLRGVLFGFDPRRVAAEYRSWEQLLDRIVDELEPRGKIRRESRSIWPRYCRSLISGAAFLSQFKGPTDFYAWCDRHDGASLPSALSGEITGIGFALACSLMMELGDERYLKPDGWVIRFCNDTGIESSKDPRTVFAACVREAERARMTPFAFDRVVWLICTGNFWKHGVQVRSQLERFLRESTSAPRH